MNKIRVRFAPAPTGFMHLGNARTALINYLFAKQKHGTFVLRVEDTDFKRTIENGIETIFENLQWLGLDYDEGPIKQGPYIPYFQSERASIYKRYLDQVIDKGSAYRCFCTTEELEAKRTRQIALKVPPRYDRTCLNLSSTKNACEKIEEKLHAQVPFIWRFKLDETKKIQFFDLAHKEMIFDLKNFSDIPITRQDGSFTFLFANFVDDYEMKISHVFRGEDHLSNTAAQVALYDAFNFQVPTFWHLPIIANKDGKKLSKRDFGFSLNDLISTGFLPEAICNYLAIIGGSFKKEIMSMPELIESFDFNTIKPTGMIKYDIEKLNWVNHQWILNYDLPKLAQLCKPYLHQKYTESSDLTDEQLLDLVKLVQPDLITLNNISDLVSFYFEQPKISKDLLNNNKFEDYKDLLHQIAGQKGKIDSSVDLMAFIKELCKTNNKSPKELFMLLRILLTGKATGPSMIDLISFIGLEKFFDDLKQGLLK